MEENGNDNLLSILKPQKDIDQDELNAAISFLASEKGDRAVLYSIEDKTEILLFKSHANEKIDVKSYQVVQEVNGGGIFKWVIFSESEKMHQNTALKIFQGINDHFSPREIEAIVVEGAPFVPRIK